MPAILLKTERAANAACQSECNKRGYCHKWCFSLLLFSTRKDYGLAALVDVVVFALGLTVTQNVTNIAVAYRDSLRQERWQHD